MAHSPSTVPNNALAPVVADIPTLDAGTDADVFNILGDDRARSRSSSPSVAARRLPWYKTPSPFWILPMAVLSAALMVGTMAPRTELYIKLACNEISPDYLFVPPPVPVFVSLGDEIPSDPRAPIYVPPPPPPNRPSINLPSPNKKCAADPNVQAAVAKLSTAMTTGMGVLSCVTTGSWAQLSDRIGRTRILSLVALGALLTDIVLILVVFYAEVLPGGYRFLIVGSILDGCLGGFATAMATSHAYVSDSVTPAARSRIFSLYIGAVFLGMAFGPTLAAILTSKTNDLLSTFYVATGMHFIYTIVCLFFIPESLGEKERAAAMDRYQAAQRTNRAGWLRKAWTMVVTFASPLAIFIPRKGPKCRDWSLTWIGIAFGSTMLNMGSYTFKFQYALGTFGWGTTELGYWMSIIGASRAIHLLIILPLLLKFIQMFYTRVSHTHIDLLTARLSLAVECIGYIALSLIVEPRAFVIATCWMSLSGGFVPAVKSLALSLSRDAHRKPSSGQPQTYGSVEGSEQPTEPGASETGRLFGALSVLQALTSQIIGPSLFGAVYVNTIGNAPRAIFWVSLGCIMVSVLALGMVRLKNEGANEETEAEGSDEESQLLG